MLLHQFILKAENAQSSTSFVGPEIGREFDEVNYLLNWTKGGFQTGQTYLELLKHLVETLDREGIQHTSREPFLLLTDGHTSRLTLPVLDFCDANGIE